MENPDGTVQGEPTEAALVRFGVDSGPVSYTHLAAKAKGRNIYHLNIGQPDIETPKAFFDAVRSFDLPVLEYAPSPGAVSYTHLDVYKRQAGLSAMTLKYIAMATMLVDHMAVSYTHLCFRRRLGHGAAE